LNKWYQTQPNGTVIFNPPLTNGATGIMSEVFTASFWDRFGDAFGTFGQELFFGCLVVGTVCGLVGYIATYYGVVAYRRRRASKQAQQEELSANAGDLAA